MTKKEAEILSSLLISKGNECDHIKELAFELVEKLPGFEKHFNGSFVKYMKEVKNSMFFTNLFQPKPEDIKMPDGYEQDLNTLFVPFDKL